MARAPVPDSEEAGARAAEVRPEAAVRAAEKGSGVAEASAAELASDLAVDQELGPVLAPGPARARALETVPGALFGSECPAVAEVVPAPVQVAAAMDLLAAVRQEARGAQEAVVREALALGPVEASEDQAARAPEAGTAG